MKETILKKAFKVWHEGMLIDSFYGDYTIDDLPITYAKTPSEAKSLGHFLDDYEIDGKPHDFTDIKVIRSKNNDILMLENGEKIERCKLASKIRNEKRIKERIDKINRFPDNTNFYIQNGFVGNSVLWWAANGNGYTTDISKAQLYTKEEVLKRFVKGREEDIIWNAKHIIENIRTHVDHQYLNKDYRA